jgi:hypothetical protein
MKTTLSSRDGISASELKMLVDFMAVYETPVLGLAEVGSGRFVIESRAKEDFSIQRLESRRLC